MSTPSNPGYETIPDDDDNAKNEEEPMELSTSRTSSNMDDDGPFNIRLLASGALLLILAFIGGRSSMHIGASGKGNNDVHLNKEGVPTRLCEIYHDPKSKDSPPSNIRMIQTSLSEPSKQWSEVSCIHRTLSDNNSRRKLHPSDTSHDNHEEEGYTTPSAIINVNFDNVAFPEREPIVGFGGAFTEAAALNFGSLSKEGKNVALELLFGRDGLGYRYVRTCL